MRFQGWLISVCVCCLSPLLTGCWGYEEFEHKLYPHAIAVDKVDGQYVAYVQILDMRQLGKIEGSQAGESPGAWVASARGNTLDEAAHEFYQKVPRSINWGHVNALVLTNNLLKDREWTKVFDIFTRYSEFRYTTWVFSTAESPQEILSTEPVIENSPVYSGIGDPYELYRESSFIRPVRLNRLIANLREPAEVHLIPQISIDQSTWSASNEQKTTLTLTGYSLLNDQLEFVSNLSKEESVGMRWVDPHLARTTLNLAANGKLLGSAILTKPRIKIGYIREGQNIRYQLNVSIRGVVAERYNQQTLDVLDSIAEREIEHEIRNVYADGLEHHVDLLGLEDVVYRRNPAFYHQLTQRNGLFLRSNSLSVKVHVSLLNSIRTLEGTQRFLQGT
ncbi:Ger(x)C family spore germination protein [Alicyclobacillus cycloheptanicus]|uniref:Ger(X)C family germination protein n=1 Tax=Alicyclobacillus cycloheptanicus TaxID=1457 RepID=A0ABT9XDL9_9BACL|nr:Ger(x)C family spore germination protein [Alicyclobacillus cycloheptanicus]MDQ0188383.1 Ger(x)C family germination protein [Alicyclobacillus cycloheptanicus]WDM01089.1 Ger(x)C family spore germination protein [Alicyclobacillus cycloheptanicus]